MQAGLNAFTLSPKKWIDATNALGIISKSGRYGGTFAHSFAWVFSSVRTRHVSSERISASLVISPLVRTRICAYIASSKEVEVQ